MIRGAGTGGVVLTTGPLETILIVRQLSPVRRDNEARDCTIMGAHGWIILSIVVPRMQRASSDRHQRSGRTLHHAHRPDSHVPRLSAMTLLPSRNPDRHDA